MSGMRRRSGSLKSYRRTQPQTNQLCRQQVFNGWSGKLTESRSPFQGILAAIQQDPSSKWQHMLHHCGRRSGPMISGSILVDLRYPGRIQGPPVVKIPQLKQPLGLRCWPLVLTTCVGLGGWAAANASADNMARPDVEHQPIRSQGW